MAVEACFALALFGWVFGDIMVLITIGTILTLVVTHHRALIHQHNNPITIGTILTLVVTPYLMRTVIYVRAFFS
ncbi:MAG TPA: hypothetical protein P5168_04805 [Candidatus Methanomethylicus sp.]|nr:hypothetical protein [Candidatus Methanomethylicus sp.]